MASTAEEIKQSKRQLSIKTGVVKRLTKEYSSYLTESKEQQSIAERLEAKEGADAWDIQNSKKVLDDTLQMIGPAKKRAQEALVNLNEVITFSQSEPEVSSSEEYTKAQEVAELAAKELQ